MTTRDVTYTNYHGATVTRSFAFNMTEAELMELNISVEGGFPALVRRIIAANETGKLVRIFKDLVLNAYGEVSQDGERFIKTPELRQAFEQCPAYSKMFMSFATDGKEAAQFLNDIMPDSVKKDDVNASMEEAQKLLTTEVVPASLLGTGGR